MRPHIPLTSLQRFLALATPYWRSKEGRTGWLLLAIAVVLQALSTYSSVKYAEWNNHFFSALESKEQALILKQVFNFVVLLSAMSVILVNRNYFLKWLKLHWRRWMTHQYTSEWLENNRFYHIKQQDNIDNIDQRISEDVAMFTDQTLGLTFDCLNATLSVGSFSVVLWSLSGSLDFTLFGQQFSLVGYLVYGAFLYALVGFFFARFVGKPIRHLSWTKQKVEADYRGHMMRITEHSEAIALSRAAGRENDGLKGYFNEIYSNAKSLMKVDRRLNLYTLFYSQAMLVAPLVLSMPRYLSGALTLGGLMQLRIAFAQVVGSLSWFTNSYDQIMVWYATMDRLWEIREEINRIHPTAGIRYGIDEQQISVNNLTLYQADGAPLFQLGRWSMVPGQRIHLNGHSGVGKTSLIKALNGLWPNAEGEVNTPENMLVLSQRDFIPSGSLRQALTYPYDATAHQDQDQKQALTKVGLPHLRDQLDRDDNWHQRLSGGERQRLILAKCFLFNPKWLLLDEAFSAIDHHTGRKILERLLAHLPDSAILCVSHAPWIRKYFPDTLNLTRADTL